MKILFLTLYPEQIASTRYRVYQFIPYLKKNGFKCTVIPAISQDVFLKLHSSKKISDKFHYQFIEFINRLNAILRARKYDVVFVQKGLLSLRLKGLPEILLVIAKKIVFDFDDFVNLWPPQKMPGYLSFLEDVNQIPRLIKYAKYNIVGNKYLRDYALAYNSNVSVIPTSIDTNRFYLKEKVSNSNEVTIGWIGSSNTINYLDIIKNSIKEIAKKYNIKFKIIADKSISLDGVNCIFKEWKHEEEVEDLHSLDVGIMPLVDNEFTLGKCGLKALQYMASGIPCVLSPVGINKEIVAHGVDGFYADTDDEWIQKLNLLIKDKDLRLEMGLLARKKVEDVYSLKINAPKLKKILENVINA